MPDPDRVVTAMTSSTDDEDRTPLREDFARAFAWVLQQHGLTHRALADRLGWKNHSRIYAWLDARAEPFPYQVFAVERAIGLPPGTLSRTLGYLPPEARSANGPQVSFDEALDAHPYLPAEVKRTIRFMVGEFTPAEAKRPRRRR